MNRRAFVPGLEAVWCVVSIVLCVIFGLLSVPAGKAQQPQRPYRIGWLSLGSHSTPYLAALRESLRGLGYAEGTDFVFDGLWAGGKEELLPKLADELVAKRVDLIVASGDQVIKAAKRATATIPIVMIACDAMEAGLVASLARPEGNVTGITCVSSELSGKRLELLSELLPRLSRVAVLYNPSDPGKLTEARRTLTAGKARRLHIQPAEIQHPTNLGVVFKVLGQERTEALVVLGDALTFFVMKDIVDFAASARIPAIYGYREFVDGGGLMAYGPNLPAMYRVAARYVAKLLKGAKPADLPIEQPTKFEFVINLRTAKALGLTIPPSLLLRADEVIQ